MNTSNKLINEVHAKIQALASPERATASKWFFKTGPGQYGEGDQFIGLTVPQVRILARQYKHLDVNSVLALLKSPIHEERQLALFILVKKYQLSDQNGREKIYQNYLNHTKFINNWDLVDGSAEYIVGAYLSDKSKCPLERLAKSADLWQRRIAILATFRYIKEGECEDALKIATILLYDKHDLIQKAVGWMLREIGKKCSVNILTQFLDKHAATMPRTTLRYAIEHFDARTRLNYLNKSKDK